MAMYWGGMILSSFEAALAYETALANLVRQRNAMFDFKQGDSWWAKHYLSLITVWEVNQSKFPENAYHYIPEDPLVYIPDVYCRMVLLKHRYLARLRRMYYKEQR